MNDKTQGKWKNKIVGSDNVDPKKLVPNPDNWRVHDEPQRKTMEGVLDEVGWIQAVVVNKKSGRIIDGHMRVALALESGQPSVPVTYVDLTDEEEKEALATFDPVGQMAGAERGTYEALVAQIKPDSFFVRDLLDATAGSGGAGEEEQSEKVSEKTIAEMELGPFEYYDYVVLLFKTSGDFYRAQELFGLKKVELKYPGSKLKKIGLCRVVDGAEALKKLTGE